MSHYTPGGSKPRCGTAEITITTTRPTGVTSTRTTRIWLSRLKASLDPRFYSGAAEKLSRSTPCWMRGEP